MKNFIGQKIEYGIDKFSTIISIEDNNRVIYLANGLEIILIELTDLFKPICPKNKIIMTMSELKENIYVGTSKL